MLFMSLCALYTAAGETVTRCSDGGDIGAHNITKEVPIGSQLHYTGKQPAEEDMAHDCVRDRRDKAEL